MHMQKHDRHDVAILGGGPAGAGAAVALARAGVRVLLVARGAEAGFEGLSARSAALLNAQGLERAAATLGPLLPRQAWWAGEHLAKGGEHIVPRRALHAALAADARAAGAEVVDGTAPDPIRDAAGWRIGLATGERRARIVVDARGRRVAQSRARGPQLLSLLVGIDRIEGVAPGSRVVALADGWCWAIARPDGGGALQFVGAPRGGGVAAPARLHAAAASHAALRPWRAALDVAAPVIARAATAAHGAAGDCVARVPAGDALLALDPLSGQGVYEALAAVPMTAAAVLGALAGDEPGLRARFVAERAAAGWARAVGAAQEFYRLQAGAGGDRFWCAAADRYAAAERAAAAPPPDAPYLAWRPVLNGLRIEPSRVLVTAAQPRGAWQVDGVGLAALCDELAGDPDPDVQALARRMARPVDAVGRALDWLRRQGIGKDNIAARSAAASAAAGSGGWTS